MEPKGWLEDREHVVEEEYFRRKERALLSTLQATGFTPDTLGLLFVVPLIEVAWADGDVSSGERQLILETAARRGIAPDTSAAMELRGWLDQRPTNQLFDVAFEAIRMMLKTEEPDTRADDERDLIASCTRIAEATGEVLGLVRISHNERECLQRFVHGLTRQH